MSNYQKVLIAVDLSANSHAVIKHALKLGSPEYHVVHVIEPATGDYSFELELSHFEDYQQAHRDAVGTELGRLLADTGLTLQDDAVHLLPGNAARTIRELCSDLGVDLLVIGSHGYNPVLEVLGSTTNAVMHGISCDVLTVRIS